MILQTLRLRKVLNREGSFDLVGPYRGLFFCSRVLSRHIKVPPADSYWGEVSTRQWPDKSGLRVFVQLDDGGFPYFALRKSANLSGELCVALRPFLRKLGCVRGGPPKMIYFRLLYEN